MPNKFIPSITRVKGISERRRLPRLGKIRLGVKVQSKNKPGVTYPRETDFFVCEDPKIRKIFGEEPKELEIMFPVNSLDIIFPQAYTMYGSTKGIKCKGDGETAVRLDDNGNWIERTCPCEYLEQKKCSLRGHLQFMIPKVNMGGVYQLDTGSYNSTIDVNSGLDYVTALVGRFSFVPLRLKRVPRETHGDGGKQTHYTLHVVLDATLEEISRIRSNPDKIFGRNDEGDLTLALGMSATEQYALDAPVDENPEFDEGGITMVAENGEDKGAEIKPGMVFEFVRLSDFCKWKQDKMIEYLLKAQAITKKDLPTPAPLEEHTLDELKDLYKRFYSMIVP